MNTESKIKDILRMGFTKERRAELIMRDFKFSEENIITALKKGGKNVSEVYRNLLNLQKKSSGK